MSQRRSEGTRTHLLVLGLVLAILAISGLTIWKKPTKLGLDLQGGLEVVMKATPTDGKKLTNEELTQAVEVIRNRVDNLGVSEPEIRSQNNDEIVVTLAGVKDPEKAVAVVGSTAQLNFYKWEPNVVDGKAFNDPYFALQSAKERAKKANDAKHPTGTRQQYLFDPNHKLVAGPASDTKRLLTQARDLVNAMNTKDRPKGWKDLDAAASDGKVPTTWTMLEAPRGERLLHGPISQIEGPGVTMQTGGSFSRKNGAYVLLKDKPALTGDNIRNASASTGADGWATAIIFDRTGAKKFGKTTEQIAQDGQINGTPRRFAIVLDDQIKSIPQIDYAKYPNGIKGNQAEISGLAGREEADNLALVLKTGALPVRFDVISKTRVSATLGSQSLKQGLRAGAFGLAIVMIYLVLFYRVLGLVADLALLAFAAIFLAVVKAIPVTMTLPGIAGAILTIGVAADANIIIFERIREEYRAGRNVRQAIAAGYRKGFLTILDASAVTLITALVLIVISIGTVRGFAVLLMIGTLISLLTAVLFTYAVLGLLGDIPAFSRPWVIGGSRKRQGAAFHVPWMKWQNVFMITTAVLVLGSALIIGLRGLNLGVDFRSGTRFDVHLADKHAATEQVRSVMNKVSPSYHNATVQQAQSTTGDKQSGSMYAITVEKLAGTTSSSTGSKAEQERETTAQNDVRDALQKKFGLAQDGFSVQTIGASFGKQVMQYAIIAIIVSLLLETLYIWWRFELVFAIPVLVSLIHDMAVAMAAFAVTGREFKSVTVAALLTILGYSLYDTIIVFDRIRENVHVLRRSSFQKIVTTSLNEVLTRSLNTSVVVLLPTAALYLFGGETLKDFAFALLVGVFVGMYSSIIVASPLLSWLKQRDPAWRKRLETERAATTTHATNAAADTVDARMSSKA